MSCEEYVIDRLKKLEAENDELEAKLKKAEAAYQDALCKLDELTREIKSKIKWSTNDYYESEFPGPHVKLYDSDFTEASEPLIYAMLKNRVEEVERDGD